MANDFTHLIFRTPQKARSEKAANAAPPPPECKVLQAEVGLVMGSASDWATMKAAADILDAFEIPYEAAVISAHRTPQLMADYAQAARERGLKLVIAGAGGAAHLPGMLAAFTTLPVLGVPVASRHLHGEDSLLSIVQMPKGVPVATFAIGEAGAANAALFAASVLAAHSPHLLSRLEGFRVQQQKSVEQSVVELHTKPLAN